MNTEANSDEHNELEKTNRKLAEPSKKTCFEKLGSPENGETVFKIVDHSIQELPIVKHEKPPDVNHIYEVMRKMHRMTRAELRKELRFFHIDGHGKRPIVYELLKKYVRKHSSKLLDAGDPGIGKTAKFYDYLIIIDFECTCDEFVHDYPHEIIEFPAVLVNVQKRQVVDTFRSFVRPVLNPQLNEFCKKLTGITQETIDASLPFKDVLDSFRDWMAKHNLGSETSRYVFVTDGPWDIGKFFQMQCVQNNITLPHDFRWYVNLRKCFMNKYCKKLGMSQRITLAGMLNKLKMEFDGREHSGLDDSKNIARIAIRLLQDGAEIRVNERLVKRKSNEVQQHKNFTEKEANRSEWRSTLPYKIVIVNRDSFISGDYLDWDSSESEG